MTSHAQNHNKEIQGDAKNLKEDFSRIKDDLHQAGQHAAKQGREYKDRLVEQGKEYKDRVIEQGREQYEHLREKAHDGMDYAREYAREKPLMVLGMAFGVGVLMGLLLRGGNGK